MNKDIDKYFEKTDKELIQELKNFWQINSSNENIRLIGKYENDGFFKDVRLYSKNLNNDFPLRYPSPFGNASWIWAGNNLKLEQDKYYSFYAKIANIEHRQNRTKPNPFMLNVDNRKKVTPLENYLGTKEFIQNLFEITGESPRDAAIIAGQLTLNGLELYTETERFIYELIQNADDYPLSKHGVSVEIEMLENTLLFMHNGQFFLRENVDAICAAAKSTKKQDAQQTGYKGIGFKSVFTDAECVYINSGGFSFKFDKNLPIYTNFWSLWNEYFKRNPDRKNNYQHDYFEYQKIEKIPWQIKPNWVNYNDYEDEIKESSFFNKEVAIALKIGKQKFDDKKYEEKLINLFHDPRFYIVSKKCSEYKIETSFIFNRNKC